MKKTVKEKRTEEILAAGFKLFSEKGYQETTMADISSETQLARTTLYEYYRSKQDILFALLENVMVARPILDDIKEPIEKLKYIAAFSLTRLLNHFVLYKILFTELPALDDEASKVLKKWQTLTLNEAKTAIEEGMALRLFDPSLKADEILFAFNALLSAKMTALLYSPETVNATEEANRLIYLFYNGTKKEATPCS